MTNLEFFWAVRRRLKDPKNWDLFTHRLLGALSIVIPKEEWNALVATIAEGFEFIDRTPKAGA